MNLQKIVIYVFATMTVAVLSTQVFAQQKFALVIGNAEYQRIDKLKNTINDAQDIGAALQGLGFQVDLKLNVGHLQMIDAVDAIKHLILFPIAAYAAVKICEKEF